MKKEMLALALSATLVMSAFSSAASAADLPSNGLPQDDCRAVVGIKRESTNVVVPSISISGKTVSASLYISPKKPTIATTGTLYLEKKSGSSWTSVASWAINTTGTVNMTKTYRGTSGVTYRTRVVVTVGVDSIDVVSSERTV